MNRFVVFSGGRTGTHLFCRTLDTHPNIRLLVEAFTAGHQSERKKLYRSDLPLSKVLDYLFRSEEGVISSGAHISRRVRENWEDIFSVISEMPDVKVFHLHRNLLHRFVSGKCVKLTGVWQKYDSNQQIPSIEPFRVEYEDLLNYINFTIRKEKPLLEILSQSKRQIISIDYNDLVSRFHEIMWGVQISLEVPVVELHPFTYKIVKKTPKQLITNYLELKSQFSVSPFHYVFDE